MNTNSVQLNILRDKFSILSKEQKIAYLRDIDDKSRRFLYRNPDLFLFDKQIIPDGDWAYYLLRCGRGFGKSHCGAAWVAKKIRQGAKVIGLCGQAYADVSDTMVPMILSWFTPDEFLNPNAPYTDYKIKFKNGAVIYCYSSEVEKKGPNLEYLWCDEVATWCQGQPAKIFERFTDITRSVRKGKYPQTIITSTPKNHPFFLWFQENIDGYNPAFRMMQGSLFDNPTLSKAYIDLQISLYSHNSRGRQELYGDLITDMPGAYWTYNKLDQDRQDLPAPLIYGPKRNQPPTNAQLNGQEPMPEPIDRNKPYLLRILIGFDPSGSSEGDECGIIVVALYSNKEAYVIEDCSGSYNPNEYAQLISDKYRQYDAAGVVVETNFGGKETFIYVLRSKNANMKVIPTHSKMGKTTRAEHISALYYQGRVHHTRIFKLLEDQMCKFNVDYTKSPDRLDALGFALTELFWPTDASGNKVSILNLPTRH